MSPADVSALLLENNRLAKGNMDLIRYNEMLKHQLSQRQDHILEIQNAKVRLEMRLAEFGEFLSKHRLCFFNDTFCRFLASKVQKCADIFHSFFKEIRPAASCLVVSFRLVWAERKPQCCPLGWTPYKSSCYQLSTERQSWMYAKKDCEAKGSHLVIINDEIEKVFNVIKDEQNLLPSYLNSFINQLFR